MQTGALIAFKIAQSNSRSEINRFCREFYGYSDRSNKGKYLYERKGFLSKYSHIALLRGLIIVRLEDVEEIMAFLKTYRAEIFMREIVLLHSDVQTLNEKLNKISLPDKPKQDFF